MLCFANVFAVKNRPRRISGPESARGANHLPPHFPAQNPGTDKMEQKTHHFRSGVRALRQALGLLRSPKIMKIVRKALVKHSFAIPGIPLLKTLQTLWNIYDSGAHSTEMPLNTLKPLRL